VSTLVEGIRFRRNGVTLEYFAGGAWYTVTGGALGAAWGAITGTLSDQVDLQAELDGKEDTGVAAGLVAAHEGAGDPHTQYLTEVEADALYDALGAAAAEVAAHEAAGNPHPQYLSSQSNQAVSAANGSYAFQTLSLSNANGVSFGTSAGSAITASHNALTSQSNQNVTAGNGGFAFQTLSFSNVNGISFGTSAGSAITASHNALTTAALSNHSHGASAANGSFGFQTLSFSNVNGISFGTSAGAAITASHNALTTARASNDAIGLNTAQTNVTWTVNSAGLSLNAGGYAGTVSGFTGANASATITLNSVGMSMSLSVAPPGAAAEANAINLLGANTAGNTTATGSTIGWSGINCTLSGTNGSQVVISVAPPGGGGVTISSYENIPGAEFEGTQSIINSTSVALAFLLPQPGSFSFLRLPVSMTTRSTTLSTLASSANASAQILSTARYVIYSLGTGVSSKSLISVASGSNGWTQLNSISVAANGTQYSVTLALSANVEGVGTTRTTQYSISNTNYSLTTQQIATEWSGGRMLDIPCVTSLSAGNYWLLFGISTSAATNSTRFSAATNCVGGSYLNHFMASAITNVTFGIMGSTNRTSGGLMGVGSFSTAGGGTTSILPISAISSTASFGRPYFQLLRSA
jgi:hypothetical protein